MTQGPTPGQVLPNVLHDQKAPNTISGLTQNPTRRQVRRGPSIAPLVLVLLAALVIAALLLGLGH
ncbi:MAG: hypothetical protein ACXWNI_06935 [Candidatus Limnocylindrales bacterium]